MFIPPFFLAVILHSDICAYWFQKMALQTGVMNLPGGGIAPSAFGESPAKVLCLTEVYLPRIY